MDYDLTYPAIADLRLRAKRRMPRFAFEYLDSSTGTEAGYRHNRAALDAVRFMPAVLQGRMEHDLSTRVLGQTYDLPFGVAPVGMSGMIWPRGERILAECAARHAIPYGLSTVATATPEEIGPLTQGQGWFQLYPPEDRDILKDLLKRAKESGFKTLAVTVDVPGEARRERQRRAQIALPFKITPGVAWQVASHPAWAVGTALAGKPRLRTVEHYVPKGVSGANAFEHAGRVIRGYPDWAYLAEVRDLWDGPLWVKGVLQPEDAKRACDAGVDGIWVSNHSARQFEAGPAPIEQLPLIRTAIGGDVAVAVDSGVSGGLDILRCVAKGADFVFLGRAWHYALGALGAKGPDHLVAILRADMEANMAQIGARRLADLKDRLLKVS